MGRRRDPLLIASLTTLLVAACPSFGTFECETAEDCNRHGVPAGQCLPDRACAYPDDDCTSQLRRSPYAASRPSECVDESETSEATTASETSETGIAGCDPDFAFHREIDVVAGTDMPAYYSVFVELDHAALVGAGKAAADGSDVRVFRVVGECEVELDRVADKRWHWNRSTTRIWFAAPAALAAGEHQGGIRLYYGSDDPGLLHADWNAVFEVGSDFDVDGDLPPGLVESASPKGDVVVAGNNMEIRYAELDVVAAGIAVLENPLPDDRGFEFVNHATLAGGEKGNTNLKYFAIVDDPDSPVVAPAAVDHAHRLMSAQHRTTNEQYIGYTGRGVDEEGYWDGELWSATQAFWGIRKLSIFTTHVMQSTRDGFVVQAWDENGQLLTETLPVPWDDVLDLGNSRWLYMGDIFTDSDIILAKVDWFFLRRHLPPEPIATLGPETPR